MHLTFLFAVASPVLAATTGRSPIMSKPHGVVESRSELQDVDSFVKVARLDGDSVLPIRIALKQPNLHRGHEYLMEVSDPSSPKFGQHWTPDQIIKTFAPPRDSVKAVVDWLVDAGIATQDLEVPSSGGIIAFESKVAKVEELLQTKYWVYENKEEGRSHFGCDEYKVPIQVQGHVDFITPSIIFGQQNSIHASRRSKVSSEDISPGLRVRDRGPAPPDLSNCSASTTPDCLRALYNIPHNTEAPHPNNSFAIAAFSPNTYGQADLDMFHTRFFPPLVGRPPNLELVDTFVRSAFAFDESNLDLQVSMGMAYPLNVTFIQVGDTTEGGSDEILLEAIDASYCNSSYIYSPEDTQPSYPSKFPGGYNHSASCGGFDVPKVISTSYLSAEIFRTAAFMRRQCDEFLKLGLMGTTLLYCSGDQGVGGLGSCPHGEFVATWPSSCPYVTSVGATQLRPNSTIADGEVVCEDFISSGGGFSNTFPMPDYQKEQVNQWWQTQQENYTQFNTSRQTRGYPDVSLNGNQYEIASNGKFVQMYGTSASTPLFGAMIALVNDARMKAGKSSVGFINPTLYSHPEIFNDITEGSNSGCNTPGFSAIKGWDPATGMGTPDFEKVLRLYMSLP